jgi:hypothetical protein
MEQNGIYTRKLKKCSKIGSLQDLKVTFSVEQTESIKKKIKIFTLNADLKSN